ncbi:MAG: hypothetical protein ACLGG2_03000 [Gammaproteobacteria bacterium]
MSSASLAASSAAAVPAASISERPGCCAAQRRSMPRRSAAVNNGGKARSARGIGMAVAGLVAHLNRRRRMVKLDYAKDVQIAVAWP